MAKVTKYPDYQVWAYRNGGPDFDLDEQVRKAAKADSFGAGSGLGERDVSFFAKTEASALKMKDRIMKLSFITKVEVFGQGKRLTFDRAVP